MSGAVARAYDSIYRWLDNKPHAQTIPHFIQGKVDLIVRHEKANTVKVEAQFDLFDREDAREKLDVKIGEYQARRQAELELATYIETCAAPLYRPDLLKVVERLRNCRQSGTYGLKDDGGLIVMWDAKCGLVRLCPDESREETQRLAEFYEPAMMDFKKAKPTHRLFYSVFTTHNYAAKWLKFGKQDVINKFKTWLDNWKNNGAYCPVTFVERYGEWKTYKSLASEIVRPNDRIRGSMVIEEDPLSAAGDWNVHLNVFLLVDGEFNYKTVRDVWGGNVHVQEIKGDQQSVRAALLEAIKYSARIVPEKSQEKADGKMVDVNCDHAMCDRPECDAEHAGASDLTEKNSAALSDEGRHRVVTGSPAMTQWPATAFIEWWDAQQKFRRVRSYGCLYALHGKIWTAMTQPHRKQVCQHAELSELDAERYKRKAWKDVGTHLPKKDREKLKNKLRHAMVHGEKLDPQSIQWLGEIKFSNGFYGLVDLIQGDNFSGQRRPKNNFLIERQPDG